VSRKNYRSARWNEDHDGPVDWARTGEGYRALLKRLETVDGEGVEEQGEGGILVAGVGKTGFDISNKPEPWRRGYHECLMGAARAAEHLDSWVRDKTRNVAFPANTVIGPSNPNARPIPPGAISAPREEDCEPAFDAPEVYYMRIITTQGFTEKQKLDAALGYAAWLDYKGTPDAAGEMYKWAMDITSSTPVLVNGVLNDNVPISSNILTATTALAVHHARNSNLSEALPIFISVLRARRNTPSPTPTMRSTLAEDEEPTNGFFANFISLAKSAFVPPTYPPPPDDGTSVPARGAKDRCEEAGLMTYIGEILYATNSSVSGRESGLAWTREAVDIAEEELRGRGADRDATKTCKECLDTGLGNWSKMVTRLAKEERENKSPKKVGGWLGFGGVDRPDAVGRWESEELVVQDRMRRAKDVLDGNKTQPGSGLVFM
jgi:hypothetical protein